LGRRKKKLEVRDGVEGKTCGRCREWKTLGDFNIDKQGVGGRQNKCKKCQSVVFKEYYKANEETLLVKKNEYNHNNREARRLYHRQYYAKNQERARQYREENRERYTEHTKRWREENKERSLLVTRLRRARIRTLPNDLTAEQQDELIKKFNGCALSDSTDFDIDHVIPLTAGHGGTTYGNVLPLRHDLNQSKGTRNIFEWFEANRQRFNLSQEKFDLAIEWLSYLNGISVEDYRDYVCWCHENPHSLEDLRKNDEGEAI
jgi:hypothetical protein